MKWGLIPVLVLLLSGCQFFKEEPEVLLSNIDGEEYFAAKNGEMNTQKATLYILEGLTDSVTFENKLDLMDSLASEDEKWKTRYLEAFSLVLNEVYVAESKDLVEDRLFSFLIRHPKEVLEHLNNAGFENIDAWMTVLSKGLEKALEPEDITINSVANAVISNCKNCSEKEEQLIVDFVFKLEIIN